jgi:putative colanic acid biosynthesis UDP-glucose lipid carrier transferase
MLKKYIANNFDVIYTVLQVWMDGLVILLACFSGFFAYTFFSGASAELAVYRQLFVVITGIILSCSWLMGLYHSRKSILNVEEYRAIYKTIIISFLATSTCMYMLRSMETMVPINSVFFEYLQLLYKPFEVTGAVYFSRVMYLFIFVFAYLLLTLQRAIAFNFLKRLHHRGYGNTNIAIVGTSETALQLYRKMEFFPTLSYKLCGFITHKSEDSLSSAVGDKPILGSFDKLLTVTRTNGIKRVIIVCPLISEDDLEGMCRVMERYQIKYQVLPRLSHFLSQPFTVETFDNMPLVSPSKPSTRPVYSFLKRSFDLLLAITGIVIGIALLPFIALAIVLESGGPIFFTQFRMGLRNSTFRMVKFRTMYSDKCGDEVTPKASGDMRVTRVGKFLRKTSIDELPQMINVLRGEMSLVGPRPEMPFIVEGYDDLQIQRLSVRPGITGLWQVSDKRKAPIHENVDYDLYYIQNQSLFLDLTIAVMTFLTMFNFSSTD